MRSFQKIKITGADRSNNRIAPAVIAGAPINATIRDGIARLIAPNPMLYANDATMNGEDNPKAIAKADATCAVPHSATPPAGGKNPGGKVSYEVIMAIAAFTCKPETRTNVNPAITNRFPIAGIGSGVALAPAICEIDVLCAAIDPANCNAMTSKRMARPNINPIAVSIIIRRGNTAMLYSSSMKSEETLGQTIAVKQSITNKRIRIGMLCSPNPGSNAVVAPTRMTTNTRPIKVGSEKSSISKRAST